MRSILEKVKKHPKTSLVLLVLGMFFYFSLPSKLFPEDYSTVIYAKNGELLSAHVAKDQQWRFPLSDSIPKKFKHCIIQFEDAYFEYHLGFNPISIFKALKENYTAGKVVRGGSTISQQVIRLSRKNPKRTVLEKVGELFLSLRLELGYSKDEILRLYSAHAPFGGNVVGLEAASWRYFNTNSNNLSWAQSATLAVLPNAPSLIFPGKNQKKLLKKRNRLLKKLLDEGIIDQVTFETALLEPLPQKPHYLNQHGLQLKEFLSKEGFYGKTNYTTIDFGLQKKCESILDFYHRKFKENQIFNGAILVVNTHKKEVVAYIGNTKTSSDNHVFVDNIQAPRSSGSVLKPFLYGALFDEGKLLPQQLIKDIPTQLSSFTPQNFDGKYDGLVPASEALSRSLNIPAVRQLNRYGVRKFRSLLHDFHFTTIQKPARHYGISLVLGGAEVSLWELTQAYTNLASILNDYQKNPEQNSPSYFYPISVLKQKKTPLSQDPAISPQAIYHTLKALHGVKRPRHEQDWNLYESATKISWKTGTSFGFRDAWSIGYNGKYAVGVWIGNSDGEGRPNLTGINAAAPVMFKVFKQLKSGKKPQLPISDFETKNFCKKTGFIANEFCEKQKKKIACSVEFQRPCPYHTQVFLDSLSQYRVNSSCYDVHAMKKDTVWSLPPLVEWFYKKKNPMIKTPMPYLQICEKETRKKIDFVYPKAHIKTFYRTKDYYEKHAPLIFQVAYQGENKPLFWHLDDQFIQKTEIEHSVLLTPDAGMHRLSISDESGNRISKDFEVILTKK
ncbi:MAG: penicillin-binding protein 1C [Flavobacteriales bacterium]|nr:penicillin-binding protein 1C [Flavobacteriales bacterium]